MIRIIIPLLKEYLIYDSLKTTNVKNAVKFLDSISLITSDFQEYSIYQIEIADQQIINGDEFSVDEDGLLIGEKVALEKYLELLEKKEYSLYLFESWRSGELSISKWIFKVFIY